MKKVTHTFKKMLRIFAAKHERHHSMSSIDIARTIFSLINIALGLVAWCVPFISVLRRKYTVITSWCSFISCALALIMWVATQMQFAQRGDWSGVIDTAPAGLFVCVCLLCVTVIMNVWALLRSKKLD